ncbi:MAG: PX domain-containing protein ypt35 [Thelocarpon superellum]|nr:MAG: PX domain-containing protein ypt35 [Thelocarpon superellum]
MESRPNGDLSVVSDGAPSPTSPSTPISPPYWTHQRSGSSASVQSVVPAAITLEDHTEEPSEQSSALWAKKVSIDDYVVVSGSRTGVGAYVVYQCRVETLEGGAMTIRKRYSEFDELRRRLLQTFPHAKAAMPDLPPKSAFWRTQSKFLENRRVGLSYFLNCIMLNPEFSGAPILKEFLFA